MSNNIKYFVRTTNERLLDESFNQIPYTLLVDKEHQPVQSFIQQLEFISDYDSVLIEDDALLCKNFKERIEKVIDTYPNDIINFFQDYNNYYTTHKRFLDFHYNVCTYYPKGIGKRLANRMRELYQTYQLDYDLLECFAMRDLDIPFIVYRPCLVQHPDTDTLIQKQINNRRTRFFIDYLEELNIPYEEAYTKENTKKLTELMNKRLNIN